MIAWRESRIGHEIELAYGKSLPAHAREKGPFGVFGSNGCVGHHSEPLISGPGIIVGRKGSVGRVVYSEEGFWPIDTTYYVVNKKDHDWRFLYHLLSSIGLDGMNSHSAIPGLNRENAYSIPIRLPQKTEQQHIALALDTVENSITFEGIAIEKTTALKRATMRELFTRGLRGEAQKETETGPMPESWETTPIASVAVVKGGKRMPKGVSLTDENTTKPYIRITDFGNHSVAENQVRFVPRGYESAIARYTIAKTDVYISIAGTIGLVGQVPESLDGANLTENAAKLTSVDPRVVTRYLMYALASATCQSQIARTTGRNAQPKLALTRLERIELPLPPTLDEQHKIVAILDAIDREVDLHRRKRAVLDDLFKALLHKLMTGEISVSDLDISDLTGTLYETPLNIQEGSNTDEVRP